MIKLNTIEVSGWIPAITSMRNPKNSWDRSDSKIEDGIWSIGEKDMNLALNLAKGGPVHAKYRRMINVYADITAPLYWWKEFDTYKVGTVANSCSTMHKIADKEFTVDDFSHEHLFTRLDKDLCMWTIDVNGDACMYSSHGFLEMNVELLNKCRARYLETKDKRYWWQMIQLLPSSYNQKRTVMLNYEVLHNIYFSRKNHKLDEWHTLCDWIETLPYSELITTTEAGEVIKERMNDNAQH